MHDDDKTITLLVKWVVENYEHSVNFSVDDPGQYMHKLIKEKIEYDQPNSIYKFYSGSNLNLDSIEKSYLYFSNPKNFNDPWDCLTNREKYILKGGEGIKKHRENLGVCCFSLINENPLMWGHYTNSYKGFCVKFKNPRDLLYNQVPIRTHVSYLEDYQPTNDSFKNTYKEIQKFTEINDELKNIILSVIMTIHNYTWKYIDWNYEREYRAISWTTNSFNRKLPFDRNLLEEVYIGHQMKTHNKKKYIKLLEILKLKYPDVKLYEVSPNPLVVKLGFNEIEQS